MALTERSRNTLFRGFSELLDDEEAVSEMLSYFPTRDTDELATRDFVDARISAVEARISAVEAQMSALEQRLTAVVHNEIRTMTQWCIGSMVALVGLLIAFGIIR